MTDQQESLQKAMREAEFSDEWFYKHAPNIKRSDAYFVWKEACKQQAAQSAEKIARLEAEVGAKQAEIDRLMLEFCPDEMTPEQVAEWEKHQVPYAPSPEQKG